MARPKRRSHVRKTQQERPPFPLTDAQVLHLAEFAEWHKAEVVRQLILVPPDERVVLAQRAKDLSRIRPEHRPLLRHLLRAVDEAPRIETKEREAAAEQKLRLEACAEGRVALQALANLHLQGHLIGSTQVTEYKSPGNKKHYGTPRKRKR